MEELKSLIFSTPLQQVLEYLLQNSDVESTDSAITSAVTGAVTGAKRAAVHQSLVRLAQHGIIDRQHQGRRCMNRLVTQAAWIPPLKVVASILRLEPFLANLRGVTSRITLFGSRAIGANHHDSDYDLLIITSTPDVIMRATQQCLDLPLQLLIKTPTEYLDFDLQEPTLAANIRKGIVLWEQSSLCACGRPIQ